MDPSASDFDPDMMSHGFQLTPTMHRQPTYQQKRRHLEQRVHMPIVARSVILLRDDNKGDSTSLGFIHSQPNPQDPTRTVIVVGSGGAGQVFATQSSYEISKFAVQRYIEYLTLDMGKAPNMIQPRD